MPLQILGRKGYITIIIIIIVIDALTRVYRSRDPLKGANKLLFRLLLGVIVEEGVGII